MSARPVQPPASLGAGEQSSLEAIADLLAPLIADRLAASRQSDAEPLIDAKAAGALLGVPETWVRAQAREGRIPHVRLGHYVRFDRAELLEWRAEQAAETRTGSRPVPGAGRSPMNTGAGSKAGARGTNGGTKCR